MTNEIRLHNEPAAFNQGIVRVIRNVEGSEITEAVLVSSCPAKGNRFGKNSCVSTDGRFIVVGEPGFDNNRGMFHLFEKDKASGAWCLNKRVALIKDSTDTVTEFGGNVGISPNGCHVVVSALDISIKLMKLFVYNSKNEITAIHEIHFQTQDIVKYFGELTISDEGNVIRLVCNERTEELCFFRVGEKWRFTQNSIILPTFSFGYKDE